MSLVRATALRPLAPPQQRPVAIFPSCVKRKKGRLCFFASARPDRMSAAQPIWSNFRSEACGFHSSTRFSTHERSFAPLSRANARPAAQIVKSNARMLRDSRSRLAASMRECGIVLMMVTEMWLRTTLDFRAIATPVIR